MSDIIHEVNKSGEKWLTSTKPKEKGLGLFDPALPN
jgi:hypothetical protein